MFFEQLRRVFKRRRPEAKYEVGEYARILPPLNAPKPVARYTIIRSRWWLKAEQQWAYNGPVIVALVDPERRSVTYIRHFSKTLLESQLEKVSGGTLGL